MDVVVSKEQERQLSDIESIRDEILAIKRKDSENIIAIGKWLSEAKKQCIHGEWLVFLESVDIDKSKAARYMKVNKFFANVETSPHLSSQVLIELASLPKGVNLQSFLEQKHVIKSTGEIKNVFAMSVRELREVKKALRSNEKQKTTKEKDQPNESFGHTIQSALDNLDVEVREVMKSRGYSIDYMILVGEQDKHIQDRIKTIINEFRFTTEVTMIKTHLKQIISVALHNDDEILLEFVKFLDDVNAWRMENYLSGNLNTDTIIEEAVNELIAKETLTIHMIYECKVNIRGKLNDSKFKGKEKRDSYRSGFKSTSAGTSNNSHSPYKVLGLEENANKNEAKKAYRKLMQVVHPDKGGNAFLFQLVKSAWEEIEEAN